MAAETLVYLKGKKSMSNENQNLQGELNDEALDGVVGGVALGPALCSICGRQFTMFTSKDFRLPNGDRVCEDCMAKYQG